MSRVKGKIEEGYELLAQADIMINKVRFELIKLRKDLAGLRVGTNGTIDRIKLIEKELDTWDGTE